MSRRPLLVLALLAGCALTRNAPPRDLHYFDPEPPARAPGPPTLSADRTARPQLRLGRITRGDHLRYRIVVRTSPVELRLYETRRWTERPDEYVRRALLDELFDRRGLVRAMAGPGPALDLEVVAFEEVAAPRHLGRVQLRYVLHDNRAVLASGQVGAERPVDGDDFAAVVRAISGALDDATAGVATAVEQALRAPAQ